jgi:CelD/BcsL family acetyltransferase involved in cellulose biosynthesis
MAVSEATRVTTHELMEAGDREWHQYLLSHPDALPYHHPAWLEALSDAYGYEPLAAVARSSAEGIVGGISAVPVGRLRGRRWVSLPFTDFYPPLASPGLPLDELGAGLDALRREHDVTALEVHAPIDGSGGEQRLRGVRHELALSDPDTLFASFKPQVRRNIRKSEASRVVVRAGERREDLVHTYFDLHVETRRRLGVPPQPRGFFASLWRHLLEPGLGFVLLAYHDGLPVAGAVFLQWNGRIVYKYGASNHKHWPLRPNNLLFWECIRRGCAAGARSLDFGRTDLEDEGLRSFKASWGAPEEPLRYTTAGKAKARSGRAERLLRPVLRNTPTWFGRALGTALYRLAA